MDTNNDIENYLAGFSGKQAEALRKIRTQLLNLLPGASETISYGMPTLKIENQIVLSYAGFKDHNSIFPGPAAIEEVAELLGDLKTSKGTIQLPSNFSPKKSFLESLVQIRIKQINSLYPKKSGQFLSFYANGFLKSKGAYKSGLMHGNWEFYRKDGSLMRKGRLEAGEPVGEWKTFVR